MLYLSSYYIYHVIFILYIVWFDIANCISYHFICIIIICWIKLIIPYLLYTILLTLCLYFILYRLILLFWLILLFYFVCVWHPTRQPAPATQHPAPGALLSVLCAATPATLLYFCCSWLFICSPWASSLPSYWSAASWQNSRDMTRFRQSAEDWPRRAEGDRWTDDTLRLLPSPTETQRSRRDGKPMRKRNRNRNRKGKMHVTLRWPTVNKW